MKRQLPLDIGFPREYRLADFVPGQNPQALAAVQACADGGGEPYVYVWGIAGSGKTHLLLGACAELEHSGGRSLYLDLQRHDSLQPEMLEGLEYLHLLALDNVHQIAAQAEWETALFHLYNRMRDAGSRLLASADAPAARLPIQLADLRSRLQWGPVFQLQPLDDAARLKLLHTSAAARGMSLPEETARYILNHCPRDNHSLEELLDRIDRESLAEQRRPTIPFVSQLLKRQD